MTRRRAAHTQADYERLLRAARKHGVSAVKLTMPDGGVAEFVLVESGNSGEKKTAKVAKKAEALI